LASISHKDPRRVYEEVKKGTLHAVKTERGLRIERESAAAFVRQTGQIREISNLRKQLSNMGMHPEAIRKQIYRLRKIEASNEQVIQKLKVKINQVSKSRGEILTREPRLPAVRVDEFHV
jgi:hypothetical protein